MIARIYKNGAEINRIVADKEFVSRWCPENGYTWEFEPEQPESAPGPEPAAETEPTETEQLRADVDYIAALMGVIL